ncbi:hypothetical protein DYB26_009352 [Aphanomyces astaci]|uniref:Uncharacterized protein n=1 Tax=Aphanomyces astaci TaxID=112090 RepID=A0A397FDS0_APHAT|nr:hypothetical protein DYB26_009352 [Aphanomyces astaci]RHZ28567.1 hypothetical protein DYB31_009166 [Aphanomyces astaci]
MVSSQHLVRQALLHSRPKVWPVDLPKLCQSAIDKYLDEEAAVLKSTAGKKYDPERAHGHMRASIQTYLAGIVHMESNVDYQELLAGAQASLEVSNTASNTYVAPDKDPFCLDPIYRELSSMPFGPNETRLPDETVLFAIATLASKLLACCVPCTCCASLALMDGKIYTPAQDAKDYISKYTHMKVGVIILSFAVVGLGVYAFLKHREAKATRGKYAVYEDACTGNAS